jgi:hypothetical protein
MHYKRITLDGICISSLQPGGLTARRGEEDGARLSPCNKNLSRVVGMQHPETFDRF